MTWIRQETYSVRLPMKINWSIYKIIIKITLAFVTSPCLKQTKSTQKKQPNLRSQKLLVLFVIFSPHLNVQHILPVREVVKIKLFPPLRICTLTQCLENMQLWYLLFLNSTCFHSKAHSNSSTLAVRASRSFHPKLPSPSHTASSFFKAFSSPQIAINMEVWQEWLEKFWNARWNHQFHFQWTGVIIHHTLEETKNEPFRAITQNKVWIN